MVHTPLADMCRACMHVILVQIQFWSAVVGCYTHPDSTRPHPATSGHIRPAGLPALLPLLCKLFLRNGLGHPPWATNGAGGSGGGSMQPEHKNSQSVTLTIGCLTIDCNFNCVCVHAHTCQRTKPDTTW